MEEGDEGMLCMILGNKSDLPQESRMVEIQEIEEFASEIREIVIICRKCVLFDKRSG